MHQNKTTLLGYYGGDQTHALSAWTSTFQESDGYIPVHPSNRIPHLYAATAPKKQNSTASLLSMLARDGHHTPFEKSMLHFQVICEDASHIHLLKHRIGVSINAESARYKELKEDRFYIPQDWPEHLQLRLQALTELTNDFYHAALSELTLILGRKRAKESARFAKMKNAQLVLDISFNFRSFAHFLSLRNKPEAAQLEIDAIASDMLQQVKDIPGNPFRYTLQAFNL